MLLLSPQLGLLRHRLSMTIFPPSGPETLSFRIVLTAFGRDILFLGYMDYRILMADSPLLVLTSIYAVHGFILVISTFGFNLSFRFSVQIISKFDHTSPLKNPEMSQNVRVSLACIFCHSLQQGSGSSSRQQH